MNKVLPKFKKNEMKICGNCANEDGGYCNFYQRAVKVFDTCARMFRPKRKGIRLPKDYIGPLS